ncbi:telomere repeats-binding bouquet formation protein 1 isoform X2 [Nematostella vectensis]|uniref:telomere repeats-binding bouquet formation protein 1 isoform X2 n=1 Tax=Nematostella vectensis TaxID=45351 RepID=UPI00207782A2|nr:telomere repeats-binding bouquet formation protein 1 isoform X2 [Nematostella vectensis]
MAKEGGKTRVLADMKLLLESVADSEEELQNCSEAFAATATLLPQNSVAQDCFMDLGGLELFLGIAKNSEKEDMRKTALYILALAIENNSKSREALTKPKIFKLIKNYLNGKNTVIRTTTAFLLVCLSSNNGSAQDMVRDSKCLHKLCEMFKECLPSSSVQRSEEQWFDSMDGQSLELWTTVCSAICASLVNPQNESNQQLCCCLFPAATRVLRSTAKRELIHPVITLLGACVMGNRDCQTRLRIVGGIRALMELLRDALSQDSASYGANDVKFIAHLVSTLASSYSEHAINRSDVGDLGIVELLMKGMSINCNHSNTLDRFRMQSVIGLSSVVDGCDANQQRFLAIDGPAIMVQVLTCSQDPDFKRLATFVLHCCLVKPKGDSEVDEDDVLMLAAAGQAKQMCSLTRQAQRDPLQPDVDKGSLPGLPCQTPQVSHRGIASEQRLMETIRKQHELVSRLESKINDMELRAGLSRAGASRRYRIKPKRCMPHQAAPKASYQQHPRNHHTI